MPGRLQNKVAIITGSSSGIGRATALLFAREGASIICSDIRELPRGLVSESNDITTVQEIEQAGGKAKFVKCDTSNSAEVKALVDTAVTYYGRLDIMVNNAGVAAHDCPIWEYEESAWDHTIAVNLKGVFLGIKYASAVMKDQEPHPGGDRGWIINLASVLGLNGTARSTGYTSSKHGVMGLTKTAAWDCAPLRIHVNAICPGYTETSMTKYIWDNPTMKDKLLAMHPFRGFGRAEDLAKAALFLASEDSQWVTGVGLPVDGGYSSM